jgi:hypothetical protein
VAIPALDPMSYITVFEALETIGLEADITEASDARRGD